MLDHFQRSQNNYVSRVLYTAIHMGKLTMSYASTFHPGNQSRILSASHHCLEMEDTIRSHSAMYGISLKRQANLARRRARILVFSILVSFSTILVGITWYCKRDVVRESDFSPAKNRQEFSGNLHVILENNGKDKNNNVLPPPPTELSAICSVSSVQTTQGATKCHEICDAASCCSMPSSDRKNCWTGNPFSAQLCMEYHKHCVVLDGFSWNAAADENTSTLLAHALPVDFSGSWLTNDDYDNHSVGLRASSSTTTKQPDSIASSMYNGTNSDVAICHDLNTKRGLKECLRQCFPAACCFLEEPVQVTSCRNANYVEIDCAKYAGCEILYGL